MELERLMREYESRELPLVIPNSDFLIRLDGRAFRTYTKQFEKPFDNIFRIAMIKTMGDLIKEFLPYTGYCHSDEITLIFPKECSVPYNRKTQKLLSIIASYCSVRFNYHSQISQVIVPVFDARILIMEKSDIVKHQIWRSIIDCARNACFSYNKDFHIKN